MEEEPRASDAGRLPLEAGEGKEADLPLEALVRNAALPAPGSQPGPGKSQVRLVT